MNTKSRSYAIRVAAVAAFVIGLGAASVQAAEMMENTGAYWTDSKGNIWRDMHGNCWRSIHWSKETAIPECDPELFPKKEEMKKTTMEAPAPKMERVTLQAEALFDFDKAVLKPEGKQALDGLADRITQYSNVGSIRVVGHADRIGTDAYNDKLSLRRAKAVADYLQAKPQLSGHSFDVKGMGERQPVVECKGIKGFKELVKCLAPNRRVEVEVAVSREVKQ